MMVDDVDLECNHSRSNSCYKLQTLFFLLDCKRRKPENRPVIPHQRLNCPKASPEILNHLQPSIVWCVGWIYPTNGEKGKEFNHNLVHTAFQLFSLWFKYSTAVSQLISGMEHTSLLSFFLVELPLWSAHGVLPLQVCNFTFCLISCRWSVRNQIVP